MKIKQTLLALALVIGISCFLISPIVSAEQCFDKDGKPSYSTSILPCSGTNSGTDVKDSGVWGILLLVINILTAGIGVAAVGGVVYGSILYTTAAGSMEQTKQAKMIIFNVVIGLVAYALMFSFLNFIIPGGMFS